MRNEIDIDLIARVALVVTKFLIVIITFILFSIFAVNKDPDVFTNILLLVIILVMLFMADILLQMYSRLGGRRR